MGRRRTFRASTQRLDYRGASTAVQMSDPSTQPQDELTHRELLELPPPPVGAVSLWTENLVVGGMLSNNLPSCTPFRLSFHALFEP